jgi:hypothetical protein
MPLPSTTEVIFVVGTVRLAAYKCLSTREASYLRLCKNDTSMKLSTLYPEKKIFDLLLA